MYKVPGTLYIVLVPCILCTRMYLYDVYDVYDVYKSVLYVLVYRECGGIIYSTE